MRNLPRSLLILLLLLTWVAPAAILASHSEPEAPVIVITRNADKFLAYLFAGFAVVWIIFFGYGFYLDRRSRDLERQLNNLSQSETGGK